MSTNTDETSSEEIDSEEDYEIIKFLELDKEDFEIVKFKELDNDNHELPQNNVPKLIQQLNTKSFVSRLSTPKLVPRAFREFFGLGETIELSRSVIAKMLCEYIKNNNLRSNENLRTFIPDENLRRLFNIDSGEIITFLTLHKYIKRIYDGASVEDVLFKSKNNCSLLSN
jgi:hypothetical protein